MSLLLAGGNNFIGCHTCLELQKAGYEAIIFSNDYPTHDGTRDSDFIHVSDIAKERLKALERLNEHRCSTYILGTGRGVDVLEVIKTLETVYGRKIPDDYAPRHSGDLASNFDAHNLALQNFGWKAEVSLDSITTDSWNWLPSNARGYH